MASRGRPPASAIRNGTSRAVAARAEVAAAVAAPARVEVRKTYKLYIGGAFPRTESGRSYLVSAADGAPLANACRASRKDLREAVRAARKAFPGWAAKTAMNRGQVLYRVAELMEGRREQFVTEISQAEANVGYRNILLDAANHTVRFSKAGVDMDPGGIGKGYAVDKMIEKLKEHGIRSALISAGGSSIYGLGAPPNDTGWTVRIRHPRKWSETVQELQLKDESLSTSGDYEKFFEAGGKIYSHVMDPRTGYPAEGTLSVSVVAPTTFMSEAWTKPFFVLGREWAEKYKPKGLRVYFCEDKAEVKCAWLQ